MRECFLYKKSSPAQWGDNLHRDHELYLTETWASGQPVFVMQFPSSTSKPFYMRSREETVEAVDLLFPLVGELAGGSMREDRLDVLRERLRTRHLDDQLGWYLELRQFGCVPLAGFGLGVERLVQWLMGASSIRDCVAFPRWYGHCVL